MNRESLNDLSRIAWAALRMFMTKTLNTESMPAAAQVIQTHGNLLSVNPHVHCIAADGLFKTSGTFVKMPKYSEQARRALQAVFEQKVANYCLARGFVRPETIQKRLTWQYSGFSVWLNDRQYASMSLCITIETKIKKN